MLGVFRNRQKFVTVRSSDEQHKKEVPSNLWSRCDGCGAIVYNKELDKLKFVCPHCGYHMRIAAQQRLTMLADAESFEAFAPLVSEDPLEFPGYSEKLEQARQKTQLDDAVLIGTAQIDGVKTVLGIIDFFFIGGSMGSVVGEQLTRGFEYAIEYRLPVVIVSGGGGGARMHEGIFSLMQMAKTAQAVGRLKREHLFYLSVLTHPTMGGVYASFASLGDIIIAEPKALIGFAGPRIVEETTRQKLPSDFQTAEYALQHGMIDAIVERGEMKEAIGKLLKFHTR